MNGDGILTKNEADRWYNIGGGQPITVDARKIDLNRVNPRFQNGKALVNTLLSGPQSVGKVYGNLWIWDAGNSQVKIQTDNYGFEMHPCTRGPQSLLEI